MTIFSSKIAGATSLGLLVTLAFTGCSSSQTDSNTVTGQSSKTSSTTVTPTPSANAKDEKLSEYYKNCKIIDKETSEPGGWIVHTPGEQDTRDRLDAKCPGILNLSGLISDGTTKQEPKSLKWTIETKDLPLKADDQNTIRIEATYDIIYVENGIEQPPITGTTTFIIDKNDSGIYTSSTYEPMPSVDTSFGKFIQNTSKNELQFLW